MAAFTLRLFLIYFNLKGLCSIIGCSYSYDSFYFEALFLIYFNLKGLCSIIGCSYSYDSFYFEVLFLIYFAHSLVMSAVLAYVYASCGSRLCSSCQLLFINFLRQL